ncbi:glutamate--tRNA ligase [Anaeramoeba flamelloides]|uniref:glutamate--tRNA ligase n=1 Tax=Anaeramoeba flamelloides TaxID=1746091 RepID=A0AAV7YMY3_9EUKA|nr:glutamate--tRNA ligase cytoplasmic [Anaeramoeba flamelloides]KAJ6239197.1 glutamate--tRNA ligase [Anaeramoeba flamelloides]|eukprot:Anaeramoba_flamelloidesa85091_639.p1 GENE.a85091_639~~a85091_639.p1  ORF type:complete len:722 (-),score=161.78 a85091_639:195-2318(-)
MEIVFHIATPPKFALLVSYFFPKLKVKPFADTVQLLEPTLCNAKTKKMILFGNFTIAKHLARLGIKGCDLFGEDVSQIDQWLEVASSSEPFQSYFSLLNNYLQLRTYFIGNTVTLADLAIFVNCLQENKQLLNSKFVHLKRWFNHMSMIPQCKRLINIKPFKIQKKKPQKPKKSQIGRKKMKQGKSTYAPLPNAVKGQVVTRFPPEPSGFLHIGHAKACLLNEYYAKFYGGKMLVRFDDTNHLKEKEEYKKAILEDLATLGIKYKTISYTSDHFDVIYEYAEQILKEGNCYIDDTPQEVMKEQRFNGIESKNRNQSVEENLRLFKEMLRGTELGKKCVMRAKIDMKHDFKIMRDPSMFRCLDTPHPRYKQDILAFPLYDFACPIVDSIEGVTHALRSDEYNERNPLYYWVCDKLRIRKPIVHTFSRLNLQFTPMSKRKLGWFVATNRVSGWDDPRFPTIKGLVKRGLSIQGLREFVKVQGSSRSANLMEDYKLWALSKSVIDPECPRYNAIDKKDIVKVTITNLKSELETVSRPKYKNNPKLGNKNVYLKNEIYIEQADAKTFAVDEEITLMEWGNVIIKKIVKQENEAVSRIEAEFNPKGDWRTTKKKITWIPVENKLVNLTLVTVGHLLSIVKLNKTIKLENVINENNWIENFALGDIELGSLKVGQRLQLQRKNYYIVHKALDEENKMVFVQIPDGRPPKKNKK